MDVNNKISSKTENSYYWTGKGGAIEAELALIKKAKELCNVPEGDIDDILKTRKEQLEKELKNGLYQISSSITEPYIKYLG